MTTAIAGATHSPSGLLVVPLFAVQALAVPTVPVPVVSSRQSVVTLPDAALPRTTTPVPDCSQIPLPPITSGPTPSPTPASATVLPVIDDPAVNAAVCSTRTPLSRLTIVLSAIVTALLAL